MTSSSFTPSKYRVEPGTKQEYEQASPSARSGFSIDLHSSQIVSLPSSFFYIPNFITRAEESSLLATIHAKPWIHLSKRRLQVFPAPLTANSVLLAKDPLPLWLREPLLGKLDELGIFCGVGADGGDVPMNHVLINNYRPGEGIMPHEDGSAYYPVTATVSLGSHTVLDVTGKPAGGVAGTWRILQEPRSLLVTRDDAYQGTLHGIAEVELDEALGPTTVANWDLLGEKEGWDGVAGGRRREERTSLTCRSVRKVSRLGGRLFGK